MKKTETKSFAPGPIWEAEPDLAKFHVAYELFIRQSKEGIIEFKTLAEMGSVMSMIYIADAYRTGSKIPKDIDMALHWYGRAEDNGSVWALYERGRLLYDKGYYESAIRNFKKGAEIGHLPSMNMLGNMCLSGRGIQKNKELAREWIEKAAAQGHIYAKFTMASALLRGRFGRTNFLGGLKLFLSAIRDYFATSDTDPSSDRLG